MGTREWGMGRRKEEEFTTEGNSEDTEGRKGQKVTVTSNPDLSKPLLARW